MANNERLTKRVKKIEDWVAENEEMGGPKGYLDTIVHMYNSNALLNNNFSSLRNDFQALRKYTFEFIETNKLTEEWNEFLQEKEDENNAVQEQQTEEVPLQEEAESGEEVVEAPKEKKSKKASKKE